ncbi:hypothetical protein N0V92_011237 [Colletotrichum tropicale]|nr:hypothetical protein N0V92_011237 [Colletotrichum tropicale]
MPKTTIEAEIIDEIDSTRNDVAERLEAVLLVSEVCRTMNGGIEGMNIKAEAIEPIAQNIDEIAVLDTVKTALDNVSSTESNSKIDKKVDNLTTKLDGQTVTKMSEKVDGTEHCKVDADENGRVEAIAKTKKSPQ